VDGVQAVALRSHDGDVRCGVEMDSEEPVDSRGREASVNSAVRVREFRARVIEERPNHDGWKRVSVKLAPTPGMICMTTHCPRLSASSFTPEFLGPARLEPARPHRLERHGPRTDHM
jgi:hypothetical protein